MRYKVINRICNGISIIILTGIIMIIGILLIPRLFGYEMYAVMSGSMEPGYPVGSIVMVDTVEAEEIKVGDAIAFYLNDNTVATHRVITVDKQQRTFSTKGDANEIADLSPISFNQLIGKATSHIPMLGYVTLGLKSTKGILISVAILLVLVLLYLVPELVKPESLLQQKNEEPGDIVEEQQEFKEPESES